MPLAARCGAAPTTAHTRAGPLRHRPLACCSHGSSREEGARCCFYGDLRSLNACLAADASPNATGSHVTLGATALHYAAYTARDACVRALFAAGASPRVATLGRATTPLHHAASFGSVVAASLLLEAAPEVASWRDWAGRAPLVLAAGAQPCRHRAVPAGTRTPAADGRAAASHQQAWQRCSAPLHRPRCPPAVVPEQWAQVPTPCPGLSAALPAALRRSTAEAALLVRRLPPAEQQRLHTAMLCLARAQRRLSASLPTDIAWPPLVASFGALISHAAVPAPAALPAAALLLSAFLRACLLCSIPAHFHCRPFPVWQRRRAHPALPAQSCPSACNARLQLP